MKYLPSSEERIWAILAHLSAIAAGMGIPLPIIAWAEKRRKSNYVAFQCLQALGYQSLGYTIWFFIYFLVMCLLLIALMIMLRVTSESPRSADTLLGIWMGIFFFTLFTFLGIYFISPIIAAIACGLGKDFRYPIMGNRLARYLGYDPSKTAEEVGLIEDHEERWVAAMGHFSIIILLYGMLAPLTAWIIRGKHSPFLKLQSIQTLIYQASANLLYFGSAFSFFFGMIVLFIASISGRGAAFDSSQEMIALGIFMFFTLLGLFLILLMPLMHIGGQWAGYRTLKGDDYCYPLIGKIVEKRISTSLKTEAKEATS
ncbi:MAG TPA: DUF4870 domain-containing protein [Anaerolineales bacterium]|nr:DUF4870 domain-containing protein [Anaerolineales bacterium]